MIPIKDNYVYYDVAVQHRLIVKTVLIQLIQFSISTDFVYTQLNVKIVLYQTIQFTVSTVSMSKTVPFQTIQFSIEQEPMVNGVECLCEVKVD